MSDLFIQKWINKSDTFFVAFAEPGIVKFQKPKEEPLFKECQGKVLFLHMSGLISFGAASELTRRMATQKEYEIYIIDLNEVNHIDGSAALALDEIIERAIASNHVVLMAGLNLTVARSLVQIGVLGRLRETERFPSRKAALRFAVAKIQRSAG